MTHYIIAKYAETVTDKAALFLEISALFSRWKDYPFISGCTLSPNVVDRSNRYDLMIAVELSQEALPLWDECALHKKWKSDFGGSLSAKTIIDCQ